MGVTLLDDDDFADLAPETISVTVMQQVEQDGVVYEVETVLDEPAAEAPAPLMPERPRSVVTVRTVFGSPNTTPCYAGVVRLPAPVRGVVSVRVHMRLESVFSSFLADVHDAGHWPLILGIQGQGVRRRARALFRGGDRRLDPAAWGISLTINEGYNGHHDVRDRPFGAPRELTEMGEPGYGFYEGHPIVAIARDNGLVWGGSRQWANGLHNERPDPAMFVYCSEWDTRGRR